MVTDTRNIYVRKELLIRNKTLYSGHIFTANTSDNDMEYPLCVLIIQVWTLPSSVRRSP